MRIERGRFDFFLQDIYTSMKRILEYTDGVSYHDFTSNTQMRDAVIRNFEIMGESVKHIPFGFQKKYRIIPWQRMFDLRNFIVHEYFDVDDEILWEIINVDLPTNKKDMERLLLESADSFHRSEN